MQAVRFFGVGLPLEITALPRPRARPGWALVRVRAAAICGSDVHIREGHTTVGFTPITLGHELAGDVVELSATDQSTGLCVGDRVFVNPIVGCEACEFCAAGERNFCPGRGLLGIAFDGGMAEYALAPVRNLTLVPRRSGNARGRAGTETADAPITYAEIAMIESAGTAHHALRALGAEPGALILVLGAGGLGLQVVRVATQLGFRAVAVDPSEQARARAVAAGAVSAYAPEELDRYVARQEHLELVARLGSPLGFAHAVDCVGSEATLHLALQLLRPSGSCSVIGIGATPVQLPDPSVFVRRSLQVRGIYTYTDADIESVIALVVDGELDLSESITVSLPLAEAERAFELFATAEPRPARVVLEL